MKAFYLLRRSNTWSRCKKQSLICNSLSGKDRTTLTPNLKHYLFCYVCHFALKRSILWVVAYISCMFVAFLLMKMLLLLFVAESYCLFACWHWRIVVRVSIGFYVNWIHAPYINISTYVSPSHFFWLLLYEGGTLHECMSQQPLWLNPKSAFITNFHDVNEYF